MSNEAMVAIQVAARRAFVAQSAESVSKALLLIKQPEGDIGQLMSSCARSLHLIKGGAGFLGYTQIAEIAGSFEVDIANALAGADFSIVPLVTAGLEKIEALLLDLQHDR